MKTKAVILCIALLLVLTTGRLVSQSPLPAASASPKPTPNLSVALDQANDQIKQAIQALQAMKAANQQLIEKQQQTLDRLEAMRKEADQVRILGKRN